MKLTVQMRSNYTTLMDSIELTEELASQENISVDMATFERNGSTTS